MFVGRIFCRRMFAGRMFLRPMFLNPYPRSSLRLRGLLGKARNLLERPTVHLNRRLCRVCWVMTKPLLARFWRYGKLQAKKKIDNDCLYDYFAMKLVNVSKGDISLTIELLKILQIHVLYCLKVVSLEHKRFIPFFLLRIMFQVTSKVCPSSIH